MGRGRVYEVQVYVLSFSYTPGIGLTVEFKNRINRTWKTYWIVVWEVKDRSRVSPESLVPSDCCNVR